MLSTPQRSSSNNSLSGNLNLSLGQNSFIGLDVDGVTELVQKERTKRMMMETTFCPTWTAPLRL